MIRLVVLLLVIVAAPLGAQERSDGVPAAYRPPSGMCRIWIDGVPPSRQPAPTDCATAIRRRPPNGRVLFSDGHRLRSEREPPPREAERRGRMERRRGTERPSPDRPPETTRTSPTGKAPAKPGRR